MKSIVQIAKLGRKSKAPILEGEFLRTYSKWLETRDEAHQKRAFMSLARLLRYEPSFDFRERLWQAL